MPPPNMRGPPPNMGDVHHPGNINRPPMGMPQGPPDGQPPRGPPPQGQPIHPPPQGLPQGQPIRPPPMGPGGPPHGPPMQPPGGMKLFRHCVCLVELILKLINCV